MEGKGIKGFLFAVCVLTLLMVAAPAYAMELWEPQLPGVTEGVPTGALPPPGFYFINNSYYGPTGQLYDNHGNVVPNSIKTNGALIEAPQLVWNSGWKFLGADFGMLLIEPFSHTSMNLTTGVDKSTHLSESLTGDQWGTFNTVWSPILLSWNLPCNFHFMAGLQMAFDDASSSISDSLASITKNGLTKIVDKSGTGAYGWSGLGEYVFMPNPAISWLYKGWNVTANLFYDISIKNNTVNYQSGDMFQADYTVTYSWGKWTFGVGADQANQIQRDKFDAGTGYRSQPNTCETLYQVGPILGYDFGACRLWAVFNYDVETKNALQGSFLNIHMIVPLGNFLCSGWKPERCARVPGFRNWGRCPPCPRSRR